MNTKLFWIAVFALLAACIQNASAKNEYDTLLNSFDPEIDPLLFGSFGQTDDDTDRLEEENAQDAKDSTSSNDKIPNDERIHEAGVLYDGDYHTFTMKACEFVEVILKKNDIEIKANNAFNTREILVTSVQFEKCDDISAFDCQKDSFCEIQDLSEDMQGIKLGREACKTEVLYLYPIPIDQGEVSEFEVKIVTGDALECEADSSSTTPTDTPSETKDDSSSTTPAETPSETSEEELAKAEEACAKLTIDTCQSTENACSSQCMWVTCGVRTQEEHVTNTSSSCVPLKASFTSLQQRCQAKDEFSTASEENQIIEYPICIAAEHEVSQSPSIIYHPASQIIGLTVLTLFTLFLVVICFYRCQFRKNGEGPFTPPSFCPGFVFPRQKLPNFMQVGTEKRHEMAEYEPPVPVL